jgi:hypothetical protein
VPSSVSSVMQPNVSTSASGAYPMPTLSYAAVTAQGLDKQSCHDYADLIDYAVGRGQVQGVQPGQLPPGYAPLPTGLVKQSSTAAQVIISHCGPTSTTPPPPARGEGSSGTGSNSGAGSNSTSGAAAGSGAGSGSGSSPTTGSAASGGTALTTGSPRGTPGTGPARGNATLSATSGSTNGGSTSGVAFALTRFVLPVLLAVGLIALLGARWLDVWPRRVRRSTTRK